MDPKSRDHNAALAEAVFHYSARTDVNERFKICISTKEMDDAAYKYAHHSQLILDGTFGVCSSRLLLFIAMAVDEDRKGVPIALFLFSAPTGNRATQAGYNTEILRELLSYWKEHLVRKYGTFEPYTCITDTDTKERGALVQVWPKIILLICRFHLRQCWTNHRKKIVMGSQNDYWKNHVREHLQDLEVFLIATVEHPVAMERLSQSRVYLTSLADDPAAKLASKGGISHLDYLEKYWMPVPMWQSWSEWGHITASALLKIAVEDVIPTTNHLESFNAILKRKYIRSWLHSGHRLRFDVLIMLLVTRILPDIFKRRVSRKNYRLWVSQRFKEAAGGVDLRELQEQFRVQRKLDEDKARQICWWPNDEKRRSLGEALVLSTSQCVYKGQDSNGNFYTVRCPSSKDVTKNYTVFLHQTGRGSCTCLDFDQRGGACKHLWSLRQCVDYYVSVLHVETPFNYPATFQAAQQLAARYLNSLPDGLNTTLSAPMLDWKAVQTLGQDNIGLGGDLDEGELEDEDECIVPVNEYLVLEGYDAQAAIHIQRIHRLEHEMEQVLPSLHGINNLLSDKPTLRDNRSLEEFQQVLRLTISKLNALQLQPKLSQIEADKNHGDTSTSNSRKRKDLKAPSPERGQKRKASHGTM
ncbi:hypothetical protein EV368DRAFT_90093 [Lentinula lateritia]|nr:hypothetical protein EV368DRAFT_90093 [Lentinula lateritia]